MDRLITDFILEGTEGKVEAEDLSSSTVDIYCFRP